MTTYGDSGVVGIDVATRTQTWPIVVNEHRVMRVKDEESFFFYCTVCGDGLGIPVGKIKEATDEQVRMMTKYGIGEYIKSEPCDGTSTGGQPVSSSTATTAPSTVQKNITINMQGQDHTQDAVAKKIRDKIRKKERKW